MKLNLCGPFQDPSGYGEFARFFAYSMITSDTEVSCENISLPSSINKPLDFGLKGSAIKDKITLVPKAHDINIIFMIPPLFKLYYRKQAKYNIGFTMFEADILPKGWAEQCNELDAIFVPSEWNKAGFIKSGVTKPIFVVPAGMAISDTTIDTNILKNDKFTFYSIFQWTERKNPINLLKAYFVAMQDKQDVQLVLKTYIDPRTDSKDKIIVEIDRIKKGLKLSSYPEIKLITDFLSNQDIKELHLSSHCFLTPHRSEGWHMPAMEAMALGNAVIATNYSGNTQFMTPETTLLLPYFTTPCISSDGFAPFFNGTMRWAEPNIEELIKSMQGVYHNRVIVQNIGLKARQHILGNFNENSASQAVKGAIHTIVARQS